MTLHEAIEVLKMYQYGIPCDFPAHSFDLNDETVETLLAVLDELDSGDFVRVVRCADCKWKKCETVNLWGEPAVECTTGLVHYPDYYCAEAVPKCGEKETGNTLREVDKP